MNYRKEIDGLRSIAVLPVIFFHAGFALFSGGYVGVDVFFVISGYLITSIIISKLKNGSFSFKEFYERRIRRIFPVLFFITSITIPLSIKILTPADLHYYAQSLIALSLFCSNFIFWRQSGYFDTSTELKPLIHTWSLSLEEQYYILFPLFLFFSWKLGKKFTIISLSILFIISLSLAEWGNSNYQTASFYLLPTRGFELLIGVFCSFYAKKINDKNFSNLLKDSLGILGLCLICYAVFNFDHNTPSPGLYILIPTLGTALIILFSTKNTIVAHLLSKKIFVLIGLISYSAYLWHQPILAFLKYQYIYEVPFFQKISAILLVFPLSYLSWKYIEKPFRDGKYIKNSIILKYILIFSLFIPIGFLLLNQNTKSDSLMINTKTLLKNRQNYSKNFFDNKLNALPDIQSKKFLIVGDSMYLDALNIISTVNKFDFDVSSTGGCPPHNNINSLNINLRDACSKLNEDRFSEDFSKYDGVIIIAMYDWFRPNDLKPYLEHLTKNKVKNILIFGGYFSLDTRVDRLIKYYNNDTALKSSLSKHIINEDASPDIEFYKLGEKYDFQFISIRKLACKENDCRLFFQNKPFTIDNHHLSESFTKLIAKDNENAIKNFLNK